MPHVTDSPRPHFRLGDDPFYGIDESQELEDSDFESDEPQCRICLSEDSETNLIAPCDCSGSSKWVHRECLDTWRGNQPKRPRFTECSSCKCKYRLHRVAPPGETKRKIHCYLSVAIDVLIPILVVIIVVLIIGSLMAWYDPGQYVAEDLYHPLGNCSGLIAHGITAICFVACWSCLSLAMILLVRNWRHVSELSADSISIDLVVPMMMYGGHLTKIPIARLIRGLVYLCLLGGLGIGYYFLQQKIQASLHQRREEAGLTRQTDIYVVMNRA